VALTLESLARADLTAGRLAAPRTVRPQLKPGYYVVSSRAAEDEHNSAALRQGLHTEVKGDVS